jgi:hypothetical protein
MGKCTARAVILAFKNQRCVVGPAVTGRPPLLSPQAFHPFIMPSKRTKGTKRKSAR